MILIDSSLWIAVFRDRTGGSAKALGDSVGQRTVATAPMIRCEVLQGAIDAAEWQHIEEALAMLHQLTFPTQSWIDAARIYFDLRRGGKTVRSTLDCCIAQLALDNNAELFHCDRDFEEIAMVRPLRQYRLHLGQGKS